VASQSAISRAVGGRRWPIGVGARCRRRSRRDGNLLIHAGGVRPAGQSPVGDGRQPVFHIRSQWLQHVQAAVQRPRCQIDDLQADPGQEGRPELHHSRLQGGPIEGGPRPSRTTHQSSEVIHRKAQHPGGGTYPLIGAAASSDDDRTNADAIGYIGAATAPTRTAGDRPVDFDAQPVAGMPTVPRVTSRRRRRRYGPTTVAVRIKDETALPKAAARQRPRLSTWRSRTRRAKSRA